MIAWAESVEHTVHLSKVAERLVRRPTAPTSFTDFTSAGVKRFGSETRIQIHKTRLKVSSSGTHKHDRLVMSCNVFMEV